MALLGFPARVASAAAASSTKGTASGTTYSAYLDLVTPDGTGGLVLRVSHDPDVGTADVGAYAFLGGEVMGFTTLTPCPELGARRSGDADTWIELDTDNRTAVAAGGAWRTADTPDGPGPIPLHVSVRYDVTAAAGSNLAGRDEQIVLAEATVSIDGTEHRLRGWGHRHTQIQDTPRFVHPFTYASLRGDDAAAVLLVTGARSAAFGRLGDRPFHGASVTIDPPGPACHLELRTGPDAAGAAAGAVAGELHRTYGYSIRLGGTRRPGSLVAGTLGSAPVSGVMNDFEPAPST